MLECLEKEPLQFQVMIRLAIMTGCRLGELVALQFGDFDYQTNKVTISRSAYKLKGKPVQTKAPKDNDVRTVAVSADCIALVRLLQEEKLREAMRIGSKWCDGDWLFTQWNGEIMYPQTPSKQFAQFLEKNGIAHRKFHALRHTSATLLLYGGVNIKQVQERLGHGDVKTTNLYLHCIAEADEQAANVLQNLLISHKVTENSCSACNM
ncbi:MAG: site-specific integrase [Oscillospiraceae bacterium]|nr:site-specific integrase [Oscillospiraceae bacterium]